MQRWSGVVHSAVCYDRAITNPMLDDRFVNICRGLSPADKRNSYFLGRLQVELDPALADIPLDRRPPPVAFAHRTPANSVRFATTTLRKIGGKARQRAFGQHKPPGGGNVLASKVLDYWCSQPGSLDPIRDIGVFREEWLDAIENGAVRPDPASISLLINLLAARR
jgi:asparagine synthase (glutamine-hydrolysing)